MALFKVVLLLGSLLAVEAGIIFPDEKQETKNTKIVTEINEIVTETNEMVTENNEMVTENHEMITEINQILFGTDQNQETGSQSSEFRSQLPNNETDISSNLIVFEPTCGDGEADYCEDPPAYPERDILQKIQNQNKLIKSMFHKEDIRTRTSLDWEEDRGEELENVCEMEMDIIMPRVAKNTNGKFVFIVNHPEGATEFEQLVRVGRCLGTGVECGRGEVFSETRTECRQNYLEHKLVTITEDGEDVVVDTFRFPSCCTCHIVRPFYDYDK